MFRKTLLSALLLALAVQSVRGKPSCCCPCTSTPPPCTNPPTTEPSTTTTTTTTTQAPTTSTTSSPIKTNCVDPPAQRQPCSANQQVQCIPCTAPVQAKIPKPCEEPKNTTTSTTTTTTTTTERPTTTTALAPPTTTASPKSNCANGEIYPANTGSCDQFLMCRDQLYVLMVCPPGFGFNHQMKSCDWSANVPACSTQ